MTSIIIIFIIALILIVWFRTDAWLEYTRLFGFNRLSFYKDFDNKQKEDVSLTYFQYLKIYHNSFLIRLITCPICVAFWLGVIFASVTWFYMAPVYTISGLFVFLIIDRLLG